MEEKSKTTERTIYPLHMFDYTKLNRNIVHWIFRFNDVLDTEKLEIALVRLLSTGDWRKLAGRLRRKNATDYEIHVPTQFSRDTPAVSFAHEHIPDTKIAHHAVAKHLPKYINEPLVQLSSVDWRSLSPEIPKFDKMIECDSPLLWIRATTFADATVLGISFPHVIMDANAAQCLLRAWSSILNETEDNIPTVLGARTDVLEDIIDNNTTAGKKQEDFYHETRSISTIEKRRTTGFAFYLWILRHVWEWFTNPATMGIMCLTSHAMSVLRQRAEDEITPGTFVSDNDILTAWVVRSSALSESKTRPLCVIQAANLRYLISSLAERNGVYLQNLIIATWMFFSSKQAQASLGQIALSNREQFLVQTADEEMIDALITKRDDIRKNGNPCLFYGETNVNVLVMNNLTKLRVMHEVDFGAAVVRQGEDTKSRVNPAGSMVGFITASGQNVRAPSLVTVNGKDYGGNIWLQGALRRKVWAILEDDLMVLNDKSTPV